MVRRSGAVIPEAVPIRRMRFDERIDNQDGVIEVRAEIHAPPREAAQGMKMIEPLDEEPAAQDVVPPTPVAQVAAPGHEAAAPQRRQLRIRQAAVQNAPGPAAAARGAPRQATAAGTIAKKELSLSSLPPTDSVLREHAKRVYYQMQIWLGFDLDPVLWGWKRTSNMLLPIMNPKPVAPIELLEMIFCGCKINCNTSRCSCKKAGIKCSYSCKNYNGQSCENASNSHKVILESDTEERQDDIEDNENL
ncbi:hypothetical protein TSAR_008005 [Trichomalopsis sarcophagae]|uniref:Tesmin/TSO1-like CXC domain-containing protein n=1 Tax=Trichomalopsis sarcophagae TaxID=543379 RepID=A0A232FNA0_9HYME|nr:hypothetical protein TSAR_008005 [Trichomalopsis sarcophagae]